VLTHPNTVADNLPHKMLTAASGLAGTGNTGPVPHCCLSRYRTRVPVPVTRLWQSRYQTTEQYRYCTLCQFAACLTVSDVAEVRLTVVTPPDASSRFTNDLKYRYR
jgi:hypothetical protein